MTNDRMTNQCQMPNDKCRKRACPHGRIRHLAFVIHSAFVIPSFVIGFSPWASAAEPYHLIDNFTAPLPSSPSVACEADFGQPKVGLAAAKVTWRLEPNRRSASLNLPDERGSDAPRHEGRVHRVPSPGLLKLWVKGNGSDTEMQLILLHAEAQTDKKGERHLAGHAQLPLPRVKLDFTGWRELTFDARPIPEGRVIWWDRLDFHGQPVGRANLHAEPAAETGTVWLDDLRLYPAASPPAAAAATTLIGPPVRPFSKDVAVSLDVRSFAKDAAKLRARVTMTDRNENLVADRDFQVTVAAGQSQESRLELAPERLEAYLPPFTIDCDVLSADLPQLSARVSHKLVMGNGLMLFDDFSDVFGRWFTAGFPGGLRGDSRRWISWTMGECQRANPWVQTTARISRVEVSNLPRVSNPREVDGPPGRYALKLDFTGDAAVYTARDRLLPGNPYRLGVWVKGDGSGAKLSALVLDYTDAGDFWEGGWKRTYEGERELCTLDFTDWRYVEAPLPGNGIGSNTPRGSTPDIDYPLELTAFRVSPAVGAALRGRPGQPHRAAPTTEDSAQGSVLLGPIFVHTQQAASSSLAVHIGYDDPDHQFAPDRGAWATVQNGAVTGPRKVRANWTLTDRSGDIAAKGHADLEMPPGACKGFRIDLAKDAAEIARRAAPFKLQVTATDAEDGSVSATREIALARPDSAVFLTDFECDRGYLGLRAIGTERVVPLGEPVAQTSTDQAHSGRRSLAMPWTRPSEEAIRLIQDPTQQGPKPRVAAIDPALPGVPTELSLWVYGDGSGVLFYPVIGDTRGVRHGAHMRQWDLFLARTAVGAVREPPLQNAVRVDWTGWKELHFRLPVVPPTWDQKLPVLGFTPSYPLGLHLAVDPLGAAAERGTLYVDDVAIRTHLEPEHRLGLSLVRADETNVVAPGSELRVTVENYDASAPRSCPRLSGGLFDWRGARVAGTDVPLELEPGERREVAVAKAPGTGAYVLRLRLLDASLPKVSHLREGMPRDSLEYPPEGLKPSGGVFIEEDVLAADLPPVLGADWRAALRDEWKLRPPIRDRYTFLDEDWDWVEHMPGNVQFDSIRERAQRVKANGADPYILLGYSAYWASGIGLEQLKAGAFVRAARDAGHAVNTFLVPERLEDWDNYVCELMRGVGREMGGWVLWNNPDSGPVAVDAKRFAQMIQLADKWRRVYCPDTPLLIGGMVRASAIPYLTELTQQGAVDHITGVNVRLDVGRLSPEDALVPAYVRDLRAALQAGAKDPKTILLTDLDWAVEKKEGRKPSATSSPLPPGEGRVRDAGAGATQDDKGLDAFDQAAYLVRSDLLLNAWGIRPALEIRNEDYVPLGLGLVYRRELLIPPLSEKPVTCQLKPAWWGIVRIRQWLDQLKPAGEIEVQDVVPGRTRCLLYERKSDGKPVAMVWRNDDPGGLSFAQTGLAIEAAEDAFGSAVPVADGWHAVGKVPVILTLAGAKEPPAQALAHLRVRDGAEPAWPQRVLAAFTPATGQRQAYEHQGGEPATLSGRTVAGDPVELAGLRFPKGGIERFTVAAPADADLILRKRFLLDETGHEAEVVANGQPVGKWNLRRSEKELAGGIREAIYLIERKHLAVGRANLHAEAAIEIRYPGAANSAGWWVLEYRGGDFPLSAVGPLHADQNVAHLRFARNIVGAPLAVGRTPFANGLGTFARSLIEYPLNGQFARFTAKVGVDAATEGRGSVVFEVYADGKKLWSSGTLSGLDEAKQVAVDVRGIDRLRLIVTDAGDGNRFDAADWGLPVLAR